MSAKIKILRIYRGLSYFLSYLLLELPRGLDFSLRSKSVGISLPGSHGYALTSKKALKNILSDVPLSGRSFLDIGSGKGGVICYAYQLGCVESAGVEYEQSLHQIAEENIRQLKLQPHCTSFNQDARFFGQYGKYDIYFMFNPFDDDIYEEVIKAIISQNAESGGRAKHLICYGGANIKAVAESGHFRLIQEAECPYRGNVYRIFQTKAQ